MRNLSLQNRRYDRFREMMKVVSNREYKGIPVDKLSGFFLATMAYHFSERGLLKKIIMVVKYIFFVPRFNAYKGSGRALFVSSIPRDDYKQLSDAYKKQFNCAFDDEVVSGKVLGWRFNFDSRALGFALKTAFAGRASLSFAIFLSVYHAAASFNYLLKKVDPAGVDLFLAFNSAYEYECLVTLLFRYSGVETYTLQHGMYYEFKSVVPFEMIGMYFNVANVFLAWGEFTKKEISKHIEPYTEIRVVGNPIYNNVKIVDCRDTCSMKVLVCLPRMTYWKEVVNLLRLLSSSELAGYEFVIRPHPSLNLSEISVLCGNSINLELSSKRLLADEYADKYRAVLSFNSTVVFESLFYGLPIVQYISGNDEFSGVGFSEFSTVSSLRELLKVGGKAPSEFNVNYYFGCGENV